MSRKPTYRIFLAALLAAALSASACGESASAGTEQSPDAGKDSPSETAVDTLPAEPEYTEKYAGTDFGGETYTFAVISTEFYPNFTGTETNGEPVNDAQYRRDVWVEEAYNVDIRYEAFDNNDKINPAVQNMVQAGDTAYDCVEAEMAYVLCPLASKGMLRNLTEVEELDLSQPWWSSSMLETFTIGGKAFITTGPISFSYFYIPRVVAFNQRLAADYDIGDLYDVVDKGKWTLDAMYDIIKDFSADLDGDGKMGEDDLWGASVDEYSAAGFFISAGGVQTAYGSDGAPYFVYTEERNLNILNKVASIIGNAELTQKAEELANRSGSYNIIDKVYTFKNGNALFLGYGAQAIAIYLRDMKDDYGIIPVPKYDEAQENYITFGSAFGPSYLSVPKTNTRGKINGVVLDSMGYISRRDVQPLVSEVLLKGKAARDETSQRMIDLIYSDVYLDLNCSYNFGNSFNLVRDYTMGKTQNFVSGWGSIQKAAEVAMKKTYEQYISPEE